MLLGLEIGTSFGSLVVSFVGVSIGTLIGFMIGSGGVSLVGLSPGIQIGSPLESPNPGAVLPGTMLGAPLGLWFGSE